MKCVCTYAAPSSRDNYNALLLLFLFCGHDSAGECTAASCMGYVYMRSVAIEQQAWLGVGSGQR